MVYSLIIKPKAEEDIQIAVQWYKKQNKSLPKKLLASLEASLQKIFINPEHYQIRYKEIRVVFTNKFPYGIYYTNEENRIFVHAVLHTKQNPKTVELREI